MNRIFYGWYIVLGMLLVLLVHGGTGFYIFGIFYAPLNVEFGWDRSTTATAITIYIFIMALTAPLIGAVTDKAGAKKVVSLGATLACLTFFMLSRINALWQFYACYSLLGLALSACGLIPANALISNWFERRRGLAIGLAMAGISLGAIFLTSIGGYILNTVGWRNTYLFLGALAGTLVLPYVLMIVKDRPEDIGLTILREEGGVAAAAEVGTEPQGWPFSKALRDLSFWLMAAAFFFVFISIGGILQSQVDFLIENGTSKVLAATTLGLTGGAGGLGKIIFGHMADKTSPKAGMLISLVLQILGIMLLLNNGPVVIWIFAVVYGFSMGAQLALQPLLVGQFYGMLAFGRLLGIMSIGAAMGTAVGPLLAGYMKDAGLPYSWIFTGGIGCVLIALMAILLTRPSSND